MGNEMLASLSDACLARLGEVLLTKPVVSGEVLYELGAPLQNVIFPQDGLISLQGRLADGRSVEKVPLGRDGMAGFETLFDMNRAQCSAVVVISGTASWLPRHLLPELERDFPCFAPAMRACMARIFKRMSQSVVCAAAHNAAQRIATWLLAADDRIAGTTMDLTQRDLADVLGVRVATASDACHRMMQSGAIRYSRGSLTVTDRARLQAHACECYEAGKVTFG
jgi:CRP-like cAMP-binding protein